MVVPVRVEQLHETYSALDEATGQNAVRRVTSGTPRVGIQDFAILKIDDPHLGVRVEFANRPDNQIFPCPHSQHW